MLHVFRAPLSRVLDPLGAALARAGVSPNAVTVVGTVGVVLASVLLVARGHLLLGTIAVTVAVCTDLIDGAVARARGGGSRWGAFLDSTMDRVADGAVFASVGFWLASTGREVTAAAALVCLVTGSVVSYAKARAEGLGMTADVGIAERPERLVISGVGAVLDLAGVPYAFAAVLWLLAALATVTVGQRFLAVWRQTRVAAAGGPAEPASPSEPR